MDGAQTESSVRLDDVDAPGTAQCVCCGVVLCAPCDCVDWCVCVYHLRFMCVFIPGLRPCTPLRLASELCVCVCMCVLSILTSVTVCVIKYGALYTVKREFYNKTPSRHGVAKIFFILQHQLHELKAKVFR